MLRCGEKLLQMLKLASPLFIMPGLCNDQQPLTVSIYEFNELMNLLHQSKDWFSAVPYTIKSNKYTQYNDTTQYNDKQKNITQQQLATNIIYTTITQTYIIQQLIT